MSSSWESNPGLARLLDQLAWAGRELTHVATRHDLASTLPRLACDVLGAAGSSLVALRGDERVVIGRHGERGPPSDGCGDRWCLHVPGTDERWELVLVAGPDGGEALPGPALDVLAAMADGCLARVVAMEQLPRHARAALAPPAPPPERAG